MALNPYQIAERDARRRAIISAIPARDLRHFFRSELGRTTTGKSEPTLREDVFALWHDFAERIFEWLEFAKEE